MVPFSPTASIEFLQIFSIAHPNSSLFILILALLTVDSTIKIIFDEDLFLNNQ